MRFAICCLAMLCLGSGLYALFVLKSRARDDMDARASAHGDAAASSSRLAALDVPVEAVRPGERVGSDGGVKGDCPGCPARRHDGERRDSTVPAADEQASPGDAWQPPALPDAGVFIYHALEPARQQVGHWDRREGVLSLSTELDLDPVLETARGEMESLFVRLGQVQRVGAVEAGYEVTIAGPRRVLLRHSALRDFVEAVYADGRLTQLQRIHVPAGGRADGAWRLILQSK